jgi:hypothetical protein
MIQLPLENIKTKAFTGNINIPPLEDPTANVIYCNGYIQTWTFSRCCGSVGEQEIILWLNNHYEKKFILSQIIYQEEVPVYSFFVDK